MENETPENGAVPIPSDEQTVSQSEATAVHMEQRVSAHIVSVTLPPPEMLEEYKRVDPAILKQILYMAKSCCDAENEQKKAIAEQIKAQSKALLLERATERRGQWLVWIIILLMTVAGTFLGVRGRSVEACALFAVLGTSWIIQLVYRPK